MFMLFTVKCMFMLYWVTIVLYLIRILSGFHNYVIEPGLNYSILYFIIRQHELPDDRLKRETQSSDKYI